MQANITTQLRDFWDAGIRGPDFVWAATGPALEAFSKHPVVRRTDTPGSVLTVAEFLRHVRRMVVAFVVNRLFAVSGEATTTLDDPTTYYLLHRNDFGLGDAPPAPASSTPSPATSRTRTCPGGWIFWRGARRRHPQRTPKTRTAHRTPRLPAARTT